MSKPLWQILLNLALDDDQEPVLSCQDCYDLLDQYTDMLLAGVEPSEIMLLVREHLSHCPGCEEIFEGLIMMIEETEADVDSAST